MKLNYDDIVDRHKDVPCVVALHGPSLDKQKDQIQQLQKNKKILRFSVNEWYDHFTEKPDYWVISNGEYTVEASLRGSPIWNLRQYPHDVFNKYKIPLLYNVTADLTDKRLVDESLKCDYFPYDTRHFKGDSCRQVFLNFKKHYEKNKNFNFTDYGNNSQMWQPPRIDGFPDWMKKLHGRIGGGWDLHGKCCGVAGNITLQEKLQQISGHEQHMSPGHTVGIFAITFATLMGCNPIYVVGLDLDCSIGYAQGAGQHSQFNAGHLGHWSVIFRDFLLDDMRILNESAKLLGSKIINLNTDSWHNEFSKGKLIL